MTARIFRPAIVLGVALALGACGFRPLYGTTPTGIDVASDLAAIAVDEQKTRLGQLIRNDLLSSMSRPGEPGGRYRLALEAHGKTHGVIDDKDDETKRWSFRLNVVYQLFDGQSGQALSAGKTFSQVSYDRTTSDFSNLQAETDAVERAAHEVGNDIRTRLAAYFASH